MHKSIVGLVAVTILLFTIPIQSNRIYVESRERSLGRSRSGCCAVCSATGCKKIIAGEFGGKTVPLFQSLGIQMVSESGKTIAEVLEQL